MKKNGSRLQGDKKVLEVLNGQLTNELSAVNQYFLHARIFKDWGLNKLDAMEYAESIGEMKHADQLIERILLLGGLPNMQQLNKLLIGENTQEILECDLKVEASACDFVRKGIAVCEAANDYVSRDLLSAILNDSEEHVDWLETQLSLIERLGLPRYEQSMMGDGQG